MADRRRIVRRCSGVIFMRALGRHPRGLVPPRAPKREVRAAGAAPARRADECDDDWWNDDDHGDDDGPDPDECLCDGFCKPGYCDVNPNSYFDVEAP